MARVLGYGGIANTNGARDFSGKELANTEDPLHFRSNNFNRRRYSGLWYPILIFFAWWGSHGR